MDYKPVLLKKQREQRVGKRRIVSFALIAALILVSSFVFNDTSQASNLRADKVSLIHASDSFWGDPPLSGNPGPSASDCPTVFKVIFLVDRSSSISAAEAAQLKATLKNQMWQLAARGQTLGVAINVYITVFASSTSNKTPFNWSGVPDVTTAQGLSDHLNLIDSIPFWSEGGLGRFDYNAPVSGVSHATNWHQAFIDAAQTIGFWTSHETAPALSPDSDFDLVVMVTDGQPTVNNGPNQYYDNGGGDDQTTGGDTGNDDIKSARYMVNSLRTGSRVTDNWYMGNTVFRNSPAPFPDFDLSARQPINVVGIIIDTNNNKAAMAGNMNYVFGSEGDGWFYANSFSGTLDTALLNSTASLGCVIDKTWVDPKIQLTVTPSSPTVIEGGMVTFNITAKNVSTTEVPGSKVALLLAKVRLGGPSGAVICPPFHLIAIGDSNTVPCTYDLSVPLGAPAPAALNFYVDSVAWFDTSIYDFASGAETNPDSSATGQVEVIRIPLPT